MTSYLQHIRDEFSSILCVQVTIKPIITNPTSESGDEGELGAEAPVLILPRTPSKR